MYYQWHSFVTQLSILYIFLMFIYLSWEQERAGNRERIPTRLHAVSAEPNVGLDPTNREIMAWAEIKSLMINWLSHPGAPALKHFRWNQYCYLSEENILRVAEYGKKISNVTVGPDCLATNCSSTVY